MDTLTLAGADEEGETRARLQGFVDEQRTRFRSSPPLQPASLQKFIQNLLEQVSPASIASLSSEYEHGDYLQKMINQTVERINALWKLNADLLAALGRFSEDRSVRVMTIHKSKGLEFHSVILLGVGNEAFWADVDGERSVFFVGISRAKHRLFLTWAKERPTPTGNPRRWSVTRTPQKEFLKYAETP